MTPRFLVDRGSATVSAALVARIGARWRLLGSAAFPTEVDLDAVLRYVAERAAEAARDMVATDELRDGWRDRERVEAVTVVPKRIAVLAPNARRAYDLAAAAARAGWQIAAGVSSDQSDGLATSAALGDVTIDALLLGTVDPPRSDERAPLEELAGLAAATAGQRPEILTILSGAAVEHADRFDIQRTVLAPAAAMPGTRSGEDDLTRILTELAGQTVGGRLATARTIATIATAFERTVESVDVGASGGAWFRARSGRSAPAEAGGEGDWEPLSARDDERGLADGALEGFLLAEGAMVPEGIADDEASLDEVIAWSPLRIDRPTHRDRLRDLRAHPWQDAAGEGALLRMAAGRAALARIEEERVAWGGSAAEAMTAPDLLVISGCAFALAPGSAVALAAADTIRRPGMTRLAFDHARLMAPLGTLGDAERLALVRDLIDDLLMPLGSLLVVTGGRAGREMGSFHVASEWASAEPQPLASGALRVIELPPGAPATVDLELRDGRLGRLGRSRSRHLGFEATGGLGGLLVDTRGVPLRLPQHTERRREVVAQWQRSLWPGAEP